MPEIIEVQKLRVVLAPAWRGRRIERFTAPTTSPRPRKYAQGDWEEFTRRVKAGKLGRIERVGKNLWIPIEETEYAWHIHLSSTGWFVPGNDLARDSAGEILMNPEAFLHKMGTVRVRVYLTDGQVWDYHDPRTWGKWFIRRGRVPKDDEYFGRYGPDWLDEPVEAGQALLTCKSRSTVKVVLTNQQVTAGIGNYLACEIAARAGVLPHRKWSDLGEAEKESVRAATIRMLDESMRSSNHDHWRVFKRERCSIHPTTSIRYRKDGGGSRGSYWCPTCQT